MVSGKLSTSNGTIQDKRLKKIHTWLLFYLTIFKSFSYILHSEFILAKFKHKFLAA